MPRKQSKNKNKKRNRIRIRHKNEDQKDDCNFDNSMICTESTEHQPVLPEGTDCPINKLNDEALEKIFSYLSKRQLIGIERVCKKWREVALKIWSKQTVLNFDVMSPITDDWDHVGTEHLKSILMKCGASLKTFMLDCPKDQDDPEDEDGEACIPESCDTDKVIWLLYQYCKNLEHLKLSCGNASKRGLRFLEDIASNLEEFKINYCSDLSEKYLKNFLMKAPKLHSLCIDGNMQITGKVLVNSGRSFKKLNLMFCDVDRITCKKILDNSPQLEYFGGPSCCTIKMLNETPVRESIVKLKFLFPKFFKDASDSLLPFPNLRSLRVDHDLSVHDGILSNLVKWFPNLEKLSIAECDYESVDLMKSLTDDGVKELVKLPNLKSLDLSSLKWLKGETLLYLANATEGRLEKVKCFRCTKLRDPDMIKFVSWCPNLKYLDLSECQYITNNFLSGVLKLMRTRTSKEPLKIKISSSNSCNASAYEKKHPLLIIEDDGFVPDAFYMVMNNINHMF